MGCLALASTCALWAFLMHAGGLGNWSGESLLWQAIVTGSPGKILLHNCRIVALSSRWQIRRCDVSGNLGSLELTSAKEKEITNRDYDRSSSKYGPALTEVFAKTILMKGGLMNLRSNYSTQQDRYVNTKLLSEWSSPGSLTKSSSAFLNSVEFSSPKHTVFWSYRQISQPGSNLKSLPLKLIKTNGPLQSSDSSVLRRGYFGRLGRGVGFKPVGPLCSSERPVSNELPVAIRSGTTQIEENDKIGDSDMIFTVEDAIKEAGFGPYQGWLLAYAGMSWTAEAMEMMLLSFVGPALQSEWGLTGREESLIASVVFGGMLIGAYSWGVLSDAKGRRYGFFATAVLTFVAGFLSAMSPNYLTLLLLRGLVGVGLGGGPVVSAWFMEFVPTANRGLWMVIISLFWTLGSILEALLAWRVMPTLGWRWLLALSSVPLVILLLFYSIVPESPRYLAAKGETEKAFKILQQMANVNCRPLPQGRLVGFKDPQHKGSSSVGGVEEMGDIVQTRAQDEESLLEHSNGNRIMTNAVANKKTVTSDFLGRISSNFASLLSPPLISSTLLLWSVFFANAFTYYGLVLLTSQLSGGDPNCSVPEAEAAANHIVSAASDSDQLYRNVFISSIGEVPGLAVAAYIVDRWGRKRSMGALFTLCGAFLLPLVHVQPADLTTFLLFGARASIMGAFTVLYVYAPEVYPTNNRSTGLGVANMFARVGGLVCPFIAVDLVRNCQQGLAVSFFSAVPVAAGVAVIFFPVETQGRPLTDRVEDSSSSQ